MLGLALSSLPATAAAAPSVSMKARAVPIPKKLDRKKSPKWPHTGNILGAGAAVEARFTIKGTEYDGHPAPLRKVNVLLPKGTRINRKAFTACPIVDFARSEPERCPAKSFAGPRGEARGVVDFGNQPVKETVLVQPYFAPHGGLTFYIEGTSPAVIEKYASGRIKGAHGRFGQELSTSVPLISTVPGGFDASAEYMKVIVGAAMKKHGKLISYGTVPKKCPKGGFPVKAELYFGEGASEASWEKATATAKAPCPRGSAHASRRDHHRHHKRNHHGHHKHHAKRHK